MKLKKISVNTITENEDKEIFYSLLIAAVEEIPACASPYLYHPTIAGEYWELDAYESVGYRYELTLTPIQNGEETVTEWKLLTEYFAYHSRAKYAFSELGYWGQKGINFKSIKSLEELQQAYPWNKKAS